MCWWWYAQGTRSPAVHDEEGRRIVEAFRGYDGAVATAQRASKVLGREIAVVPAGMNGLHRLNPSGDGLLVKPGGGISIVFGRPHGSSGEHHGVAGFVDQHLHTKRGLAQSITDRVVQDAAHSVRVPYVKERLTIPND